MSFTFAPVSNKFKPTKGQTYRFIGVPTTANGNLSLLIGRRVWANSKADALRMGVNNVFATLAEAKVVRDKIVKALKDAQYTAPVVPQTIVSNGRTYRLA